MLSTGQAKLTLARIKPHVPHPTVKNGMAVLVMEGPLITSSVFDRPAYTEKTWSFIVLETNLKFGAR